MVGMKEMSATGADLFLLDRRVVAAFTQFSETNVSILTLILWMGFRQTTIHDYKKARLHGQSGWSLKKKLKLLVDSSLPSATSRSGSCPTSVSWSR